MKNLMKMFQKLLNTIMIDPFRLITYIYGHIFVKILSQRKNIDIKKTLKLIGHPLIDIQQGAFLYIGENVTLNSRNKGYHINMHSPIKLFADRLNAEIRIGDNTRIHGTCIHAYKSIKVGSNCLIAANCQIIDGNGHDLSFPDVENRILTRGDSKPINIEDNVWIGANTIILPGVTIGFGSVITANSVVNKSIPPMVIAGGNPAKIIKNMSK